MQLPKAFFFDVFGTLVDWRTSIAREAAAILKPLGHSLDWLAFADAWRGEYQPAMEEIRAGRLPFCRLDVLHRRNLEKVLPRFNVSGLPEAVMTDNTIVFHEPVRPGDRLKTRQILRSVSEPKTTKLGTGRFWVIDVEYRNQPDELVAVERWTRVRVRSRRGVRCAA